MEQQLESAKRKTEVFELHKQADLGNLGMKVVVQKLNGDPKSKFEVDHKMSNVQFYKLICQLSNPEVGEEEERPDAIALHEQYTSVFRKALCEGGEPFKGDVENVTYKNILAAFRAFDPNAACE